MNYEQIIITFGYLAIFLLITTNGIISFPSSQLIYLIAGYFAFKGDLNLILIILIGATANTIGNIILYEISRKRGLDFIKKFKIFPINEIKKITKVFQKKGLIFLFFGKLVNPIKVFIPIPAGIAKMHRGVFATIVFITSIIWASIFTLLGYYFGKNYEKFSYIGIIILVGAVTFMYIFYKYMNSQTILKEL